MQQYPATFQQAEFSAEIVQPTRHSDDFPARRITLNQCRQHVHEEVLRKGPYS